VACACILANSRRFSLNFQDEVNGVIYFNQWRHATETTNGLYDMNLFLRHVFILTTLLLSVLSHANTTWVPINVGDITIILPYTPESVVYKDDKGNLYVKVNATHGSKYFKFISSGDGGRIVVELTQDEWRSISVTQSDFTITYGDFSDDGLEDIKLTNDGNVITIIQNNVGGYAILTATPINVARPTAPKLAAKPIDGAIGANIGTLAGMFNVDESGSATYNVPLSLPRGIAGVTPSLSLNYSSAGGNGSLGIGWSLSGLSSISRCRQTLEQDGNTAALTLTNNDRFCLDGQKLIAVSGNYGDSNTQYRTEIDSQTRITSNDVSGTGPAYFIVERVDGSISYYGNTDASLSNRTDSIITTPDNTIINWLITSTNDNMKKNVNTIFFNYLNGASGYGAGEIVLKNISYGGNNIDFSYRNDSKSTFERSDKPFGYIHGKKVSAKALLDDIIISNHKKTPIRSYHLDYENDPVTDTYRMNSIQECNGTSNGVCIPATTFSWHDQIAVTSYGTPKSLDLGSNILKAVQPFDLNGDGFNDLAYVVENSGHYELYMSYNNNGTLQTPHRLDSFSVLNNAPISLYPLDIDGDGHLEIVYYRSYAGKNKWAAYDIDDVTIEKIQDDRTGINHSNSNFIKYLNVDTTQTGNDVLFHDVNADALTDMVYRFNNKNYIALNSGGTFSTPVEVAVNLPGRYTDASPNCRRCDYNYSQGIRLANNATPSDFNGDGQADLLLRIEDRYNRLVRGGHESVYYWMTFSLVKNGTDYSYEPFAIIPNSHNNSGITDDNYDDVLVSDVNGDGLSDVLYRRNDNSYRLYFSTGEGFDEDTSSTFIPVDHQGDKLLLDDVVNLQFVDLNKDGQQDIIYFNKTDKKWQVHYRNETVFAQSHVFRSNSIGSAILSDWDANGVIDFATVNYVNKTFNYVNNLYVYQGSAYNKVTPANRIHTITNGLGLNTKVNYELMTNPEVYTKGDNISGTDTEDLEYGRCPLNELNEPECTPVFDIIAPNYLVSQVTSDAPAWNAAGTFYDATNTVSVGYQYKGLRAQAGGRGMLGFEKVTSYDPQTKVTTETVYRQDFPFIGMPTATVSYLGGPQVDALHSAGTTSIATNQRLKYSVNTYNQHALNGGLNRHVYLDQSNEQQYLLNNAGTATINMGRTESDNTYTMYSDNHVNLDDVIVTTYSGATVFNTVTTKNTYDDESIQSWWLGRLTSTQVTHSRPDVEDIIRNSTFGYQPLTGMLSQETVDMGVDEEGNAQKLTTLHCYGPLGNKTQIITHANVGTISCLSKNITTDDNASKVFRRNVTTYDDEGRYVVEQGNDKFIALTTLVEDRNALGQPLKTIDINGVITNIDYDAFGRQYFSSNSLGQTTTIERRPSLVLGSQTTSSIEFVETIITAGQPTVSVSYDKMGRKIMSNKQGFDGTTSKQVTRHDQYGRVVKQSVPYHEGGTVYYSTTAYDKFGRVTSGTTADDSSTTILYNGLSTTSKITTNDGHNLAQQKLENKNILGELTYITDHAGTIGYQYNAVGNLIKVTSIGAIEIKTKFDDYGRKIEMNDPDKGKWYYKYNAAGELIKQTNARGYSTAFYRDSVGRTTHKRSSGGIDESIAYVFNKHQLESEGNNLQTKNYFYDPLGRLTLVRNTFDQTTYSQQTTYDEYGRVFQQFDASNTSCIVGNTIEGSCWGIQNQYNTYGYLYLQKEARNGADSDAKIYYKVKAMDALGNITSFSQNDEQLSSTKAYNQANGFIDSISTDSKGVTIQNNLYSFDSFGNLRSRTNGTLKTGTLGAKETFAYDNVNRLTHINNIEKVKYYANGNIAWKEGVGNYCYNSARPHAVSGIGNAGCTTQSYQYDNNGNMTSGRGRSITYSHFDKPTRIANSKGATTFDYGTNRSRFKRTTTEGNVTTTTYYIGNVEVESKSDSTVVTTRRFLPGAIELQRSNGTREISYLLKDHLGSIDTITDESGFIKQKLYFDAWGKKHIIASANLKASLNSFTTLSLTQLLDISKRGFTGHESVDHADIIHMNGRIYDPTLGRFLQADPHIQAPKNSQSYNRYAYVLNNPLSYTDPTGYFFSKLWKKIKPFVGVIVAVVGGIICGYACAQIGWQIAAVGAVAGAAHAAANGGNIITGALMGAFTAGVGQYGMAYAAVAGGIASKAQGGNFGHGFWAAGLGAGIGGGAGNGMTKVLTAAVVGGTISKLTGGKFKNGAISAAFAAAIATNWGNDKLKGSEQGEILGELDSKTLARVKKDLGLTKERLAGFRDTLTNKNGNYESIKKQFGYYSDSAFDSTRLKLIDTASKSIALATNLIDNPQLIGRYSTGYAAWTNDGRLGIGPQYSGVSDLVHELGHGVGLNHSGQVYKPSWIRQNAYEARSAYGVDVSGIRSELYNTYTYESSVMGQF
jgi:RHS repeat-associated protein